MFSLHPTPLTILVFAGLLQYQSVSGEILPHFHVKNTFLAQILSELEHIHLCLRLKEDPVFLLKTLRM